MSASRITRSHTKSLATQATTLSSSSAPVHTSPTSSIEVERLFDIATPLLTPSPPPLDMEDNNRDAPPHQAAENPPPADNALPQAMTALAQAMTALMAQLQAGAAANANPRGQAQGQALAQAPRARIKARDPDPYDGSDPAKLRAFLSQCKLMFRARPRDFDDDQVKITYAVSWLKGTAQRWYEPNLALADVDLPDFAIYWEDFEEALKTTFGEPDPVASATLKLENLSMKDTYHITKYNVEFNELATLTGYGERALYARYYRGLATRIKDGLAISGKPAMLNALHTKAQALDLHYWERRNKERYKLNTQATSSAQPATTTPSSNPHSSSKPQPTASSSHLHSATPADAPKPKAPDLSKVLSADGKLLPAEKE